MRYYRLWIYTCNAVLFVSVIVFLGVSAGVISHPYITLLPTPSPFHPSLLYGYLALFLQAGVLQAIGCFGALRLCQKLLNTYWLLLLFLLLGDIIVGLIWLIRLSHLTEGIYPFLTNTIKSQYNKDAEIREVWDSIQTNHQCCGVQSPYDYNNVLTFIPDSCCHLNKLPPRYSIHKTDKILNYISHRQINVKDKDEISFDNGTKPRSSKSTQASEFPNQINITCKANNYLPYYKGCAVHVIKWYRDSTETLMIFGFCVITFIKLCFVGILRFEIQEMIQKIKILQGEAATSPNPELAEALGMVSPEKKVEGGLLINSEDANVMKETPQHLLRHNHISTQIDGAESDTNSHCALITDTPIRNQHVGRKKQNGNNNEITELRELCHIRQTQI